jgi:hypothetical protein
MQLMVKKLVHLPRILMHSGLAKQHKVKSQTNISVFNNYTTILQYNFSLNSACLQQIIIITLWCNNVMTFLKHLLVKIPLSYASATQRTSSCTVQYFGGKTSNTEQDFKPVA